jgi:peptide chain release factor subunit 3
VIDKFKDVGNLFVYGKIESGTIIEDQSVTILPQRLQMVIKEIYNAKDERMPFACAGENVKMKVKNIEENDISRGDMVCNNLNYCQESAEFKANITILELPEQKKLISSGYESVMHMHAIAVEISISKV